MSNLLVAAGYVTAEELSLPTTSAERGILDDPTLSDRERRLMLTLLTEVRDRRDDDVPPPPPEPQDTPDGDSERRAAG